MIELTARCSSVRGSRRHEIESWFIYAIIVLDFERAMRSTRAARGCCCRQPTRYGVRASTCCCAPVAAQCAHADDSDMDVHQRLADAHFYPDADRALEKAEDRLPASLRAPPAPSAADAGEAPAATGLPKDEVETEVDDDRAASRERRPVFRSGDPGDRCSGRRAGRSEPVPREQTRTTRGGRRLISFAPGVVFCEMGRLAGWRALRMRSRRPTRSCLNWSASHTSGW